MKAGGVALATVMVISVLGLAACTAPAAPAIDVPASPSGHPAKAPVKLVPAATKTIAKYSAARHAATPRPVSHLTDPWAVVSEYYSDIELGDYPRAWALLNSAMTTGQSFDQFVNGFTCTGAQNLTENWESGNEVSFNLEATDDCSGARAHFTGTDTVLDGKITATVVTQTG